MTTRREILSAMAATATGAVGGEALGSANPSGAMKPSHTAKMAKPIEKTRGLFVEPSVKALQVKYQWMSGLDKLAYEHIRDVVQECDKKIPPYDGLLYEALLSDASKSLDRCVAYRNQCSDLEAQAVRRALEYSLFQDTYEQQMALQDLQTETAALVNQKKAYDLSAAAFGNTTIDNGFKALHKGSAESIADQVEVEGKKRIQLKSLLEKVKSHQELLEKRHSTPGHALNYQERRDRVLELLKQELEIGYQKARAAEAGIRVQLKLESVSSPFPKIVGSDADSGFLDALVRWTRSIISIYEQFSLKDVAFERVIPLVAPYKIAKNSTGSLSLITAATLDAALQDKGQVSFSLKDALPSDATLQHVRLRSLGIAIAGPKGQAEAVLEAYSWSCLVFLPPQLDPFSPPGLTSTLQRNPVLIGRAFLDQSANPPEYVVGPEIWNADPRPGNWTIVVELLVNHTQMPIPDASLRAYSLLKDIKLHLKFVAQPSSNPADWATSPV